MLTSSPCTDLLTALLCARPNFPTIIRNREVRCLQGVAQTYHVCRT